MITKKNFICEIDICRKLQQQKLIPTIWAILCAVDMGWLWEVSNTQTISPTNCILCCKMAISKSIKSSLRKRRKAGAKIIVTIIKVIQSNFSVCQYSYLSWIIYIHDFLSIENSNHSAWKVYRLRRIYLQISWLI